MMLLQKRQHRFGRPADGGALARHHDRPLQQDRMLGDRLGDISLAEIGFLLLERLEFGLAVADQRAVLAAYQIDQFLDLGFAGRLLEILTDRGLDALLAQELEGLPRLAAARVVPDRDAHANLSSPVIRGRWPKAAGVMSANRSLRPLRPSGTSPAPLGREARPAPLLPRTREGRCG